MTEQPPATILYVDDDDDTRRAISWLFQGAGFAVKQAANGSEALRLAAEKPDVVVLDVNLPDINGFEVCRRLRSDPATARVPVLHLSGVSARSDEEAQAREGGADAYLVKPVEPQEILATLHALLRTHQAEDLAHRGSLSVTLTVRTGHLGGKQFTFHEPGKRLVGRAEGCDVCLPNDRAHQTVSRWHCVLDIQPDRVCVLDVGSRNGTYVNGEPVAAVGWPPEGNTLEAGPEGCPLHDGDALRVGNTVFQIHIAGAGTDPEPLRVSDTGGDTALR
jgi:CheY-like chemotaxis protein